MAYEKSALFGQGNAGWEASVKLRVYNKTSTFTTCHSHLHLTTDVRHKSPQVSITFQIIVWKRNFKSNCKQSNSSISGRAVIVCFLLSHNDTTIWDLSFLKVYQLLKTHYTQTEQQSL